MCIAIQPAERSDDRNRLTSSRSGSVFGGRRRGGSAPIQVKISQSFLKEKGADIRSNREGRETAPPEGEAARPTRSDDDVDVSLFGLAEVTGGDRHPNIARAGLRLIAERLALRGLQEEPG